MKDNPEAAGMGPLDPRRGFVLAWSLLFLAKAWLAFSLQPFGDEAFYALESRRLAWAYSDLPGLTAWLIRVGTELGGQHALAMRAPFLVLGACLPWLARRIAARWFGERAGWQAAWLVLLMPLSGLMGVLALPDVPMLVAALLCLDAFASLLQRHGAPALAQLALALCLGALSHYRFALVVLAGAAGLLCVPQGRALLRRPGFWLALAVGAAAWWPLLAWNLAHAGAGLEFQFVDRHPWSPQVDGAWWPLVQALAVTPALFVLLLATLREAWRRRRGHDAPQWPLLLGLGAVSVPGFFVLAFFADSERVSFHWPLPGWLALACAAPVLLAAWRPWARALVFTLAALGLVGVLGYLAMVALPQGRERLAAGPAYADNFSGWREVAGAVRGALARLPPGTPVVADNFMLGAQLSFALGRDDIAVLDHPLNRKHGRAAQLADWGLSRSRLSPRAPVLLVVEDTARPLKLRLRGYRELCWRVGGLGPASVLNVDHGRKRFLLYVLPGADTLCHPPAMAWLEAPRPGDHVSGLVEVRGWAVKEGPGVARVDLTLDGAAVASAEYGLPRPDVLEYWGMSRRDPGVGFRATLDLSGQPKGRHWLGLVIHGRDGTREEWPEQPLQLR